MDNGKIRLADFIAGVREELETAARRSKAFEESGMERLVPPMKVSRLALEVEIVVSEDEAAKGKISYWIASVSGEKKFGNSVTQKVTIELEVPEVYLGTR